MLPRFLCLCLLAWLPFVASAQNANILALTRLSLEDLLNVEITTASKTLERADQAPATVYVFTAEQIAALGLRDLKDVLALVPGVDTSDNHFFLQGGQRGFMGPFSQSLLLVDGREMNNLIAGETFISEQFRTHNIQQIEIIAGPGSALYGANAVGGVINLITRSAADTQGTRVGLNAGSFDTRSVDVSFSGEDNGWKYAGSLARYDSGGEDFSEFLSTPALASPAAENNAYRHLPDEYGYRNESEATPISLSLEKAGIYTGLEYYRNRSGRGTASIQWDYTGAEDERELLMNYLGYRLPSLWQGKLEMRLEYRHYWEKFWGNHTESTGALEDPDSGALITDGATLADVENFRGYYSNQRSKGSRKHVALLEGIYRADKHTVVAGWDYEHSDIIGAAWSRTDGPHPEVGAAQTLPEFRNWKTGLYGQWQSKLADDRLTLTLGARLAAHQRYDAALLPRGGLVWQARQGTLFKLLYGESFREPVVFELSSNPDIQPMRMSTWELAWHQYLGPYFKNEAVVFLNRAKNRIVSDDVLAIANGGTLEAQGFENVLHFNYGPLTGWLNYTYMDTVRATDHGVTSEVYDIPRHKANLALIYHLAPHTTLGLVGRLRSAADTEYQNSIWPIGGYTAWDMTLRREGVDWLGGTAAVSLSVKNLFDRAYYHPEPRDGNALQHPQEGRSLWLRVEWGM